MNKEYNYKESNQRKLKEDFILKNLEKANESFGVSDYSEEQILRAQSREGRKEVNEIYNEFVSPLINNMAFFVYYIMSLIILPLSRINTERNVLIIGLIAYVALIIVWGIMQLTDKIVKKRVCKKKLWMESLDIFSQKTTIVVYILTSMGYMAPLMKKWMFGFIYGVMLLIFFVAFYYSIKYFICNRKNRVTQ